MALSLLRTRAPTAALRVAKASTIASVRSKHSLPDLSYDYGALEPAISGKIMELHHSKHHATYVAGLNDAEAKYAEALAAANVNAQVALQPLIKFHGGGHLNHTLFWENLAPKSQYADPSGALADAIKSTFGGLEQLQAKMNTTLAGIQGSGWAWLVKTPDGKLAIETRANQDPVVGATKPIVGIDAWEHAYYLQYENRKAEYFKAIWDVINWKKAGERWSA